MRFTDDVYDSYRNRNSKPSLIYILSNYMNILIFKYTVLHVRTLKWCSVSGFLTRLTCKYLLMSNMRSHIYTSFRRWLHS